MFFMPMRSGMTRWSIWPSVSRVLQLFAAPAFEQRAAALGELDAFAQLEGVKVGDDDLGAVDVVEHVAGDEFATGVVAVGVVRLEHAQAVFDGEAGRDDQKAAREFLAPGRRTALIVCQAISIAMTVVLPAPVASFKRKPHEFGVGVLVGRGQVFEESLAVSWIAARPRSARWPSRPLPPGRRTGGCR